MTITTKQMNRKEVNMDFTKKVKEFMLASSRLINFKKEATIPFLDDVYYSINELNYCTPGDGKKNISNDFSNFGADFKEATKLAKNKAKNGETTTSK